MGTALFVLIVDKSSARSVLQVGQKLELSKNKHYHYTVKRGNDNKHYHYTVKRGNDFPVPSQDVTNQTLILLFPARESLVSDLPAGYGKSANLFLQCILLARSHKFFCRYRIKNALFSK